MALVLFLAGTVIAALSKYITALLGGRILQGVGASGTIALTVLVVTSLVSLRRRAPFYAVLNAMWATGSVSGPVIAGAFVNSSWVSSAFISLAWRLIVSASAGYLGSTSR